MTKTYLATKAEVTAVAGDVTTINTQINNPTNGFQVRLDALEAAGVGDSGMTPQQVSDLAACVTDKHAHANKAVLDAVQEPYTTTEKTKLGNLTDNFKGLFADAAARNAGVPTPAKGNYVLQADTNTVWFFFDPSWVNTGATSSGDMLKAVYDPTNVQQDAFDMDSMRESVAKKILSAAERAKLEKYRGHVDAAGMASIATPAEGDYCTRKDTKSVWIYIGGVWSTADAASATKTKFEPHSSAGVYGIGDVVSFGGALFSANSAIDGSANPVVFAEGTGAGKWTRSGGSTPLGTIIHWEGAQYGLATPDGYALCNGAAINYPGSLLHGLNAPDHRGRILAGANGGSYTASTTGGSDSVTLARSNLPNATLTGTTGTESQPHTHLTNSYTLNGVANSAYATSSAAPNVIAFSASYTVVSDNGAALGGTTSNSYLALDGADRAITDMDTSHTHSTTATVPDKTSNTNVTLHTHNFTTGSINGNVTQTTVDVRQATRYVTTLIKL